MIRWFYNYVSSNERFFGWQNIIVSMATIADIVSITVQVVGMLAVVVNTVIMADNHFKIFNKNKIVKKESEKSNAPKPDAQ